ncbi:hypothetical protein QTO31_08600 [Chloroflexus sp. MS-CIW-1]|uniref:hypothetical protein n=1 Tax=Chloroflexus sp. MS-CIW-1 TaxID=3055768 RepID=UPI002649EC0F|nr:hypothetical protein [Chloroflexus sp. MS-CIW-1]MDN5272030.1 hypothetical protein [Chloroflexus sp. MS-CIW-1]
MNTQPPHNQPRGDRSVQANGNIAQSLLITGDHNIAVFQTILQPLPVSARGAVQRLLTYYTDNVFGGRDAELAALDGVLRGEQLYTLLVAPTGRGKTALLVHWVNRLLGRGEWRVIFVPISIRFGTADEQMALEMLAAGLADLHNDTAQFQRSDRSPFSLRAMIGDYLHRPLPTGVRCLLVLDGIDEAVGWKVGPLCVVPPNSPLKIVAAARQRADRGYEDWREHLGWQPHRTRAFPLDNLDRAALIALLKAQDERLAALADDPAFVAQFERVSEGDPLTCNLLIKALLGNTLSPTDLSRRPPGLEAFLRDWVETLRRMRQESAAIRELLALCAVAYGPLTSDDLSALAPTVFSDQSAIVDAVRSDEVARFIITVGEHSYVFSHQRLREVFLEQIYPPTERERLHRRMVDYGNAWWADRHQPLSEYLRRFWLLHCAEVGEWERIREVVSAIVPTRDGSGVEQPWQTARYAAEGSNSGYLGDLERLWTRAEQQGDLGLALRCALIAASLRSQSGKLSPELLVGLVQVGTPAGTWSAAAALEHIALMPDSERQANSLQALLVAGIALPWARALEVALAIADKEARATALAALAPHLPPHLLAEALAAARTIRDTDDQVAALAALAPHLPAEQQPAVYAEALAAARTIADEYWRSRALAALAPHLPAEQQPTVYAEALAAARTIADEYWRSRALAALAPHLPTHLLAEALAAARTIADEYRRSEALAALAPHLPPHLLADALAAARAIEWDFSRARALAALAPHLPTHLFADALAAARTIADEYWRSEALAALAPHLAATPALDEQFVPTLRTLAQRGRPALLGDLRALQPWLAALAKRRRQSTMLAALATAISETGRCWP